MKEKPSELLPDSMDEYGLQRQRIIRTAKSLCPSCTVTFDATLAPELLRFRIEDGSTILTKANPEYPVSAVAKWPEEELRKMIEALTGGLLRKSA
jgi:hypothetical protein